MTVKARIKVYPGAIQLFLWEGEEEEEIHKIGDGGLLWTTVDSLTVYQVFSVS